MKAAPLAMCRCRCGHVRALHDLERRECLWWPGVVGRPGACPCPAFVPQDPEVSMSAAPDVDGNVATDWKLVTVRLDEIVLDHGLQARVGLNEEVVRDYLEQHNRGVKFPPLRLVVVDGRAILVDGWHRHGVYKLARVPEVEAYAREGTRRDAVLEAVRANSDHGLQRTRDDRRRAVRMLLMDEEWCGLSSRDVATMAVVSHTFVDQLRKRYGVEKGQVLTEERADEVDAEVPAVWKDILAEVSEWQRPEVEKIRTCKSIRNLAGIGGGYQNPAKAIEQRLRELGAGPWPWPADRSEPQRETRVKHLDTADDIVAALEAAGCPDRADLFNLLRKVLDLPRLGKYSDWERLASDFAGRPKLIQAIKDRKAEIDRELADDPEHQASVIRQLRGDPVRQATAVRNCSAEVLRKLCDYGVDYHFHKEVRRGALRDRFVDASSCAIPGCDGWSHKKVGSGRCVICGRDAGGWRQVQRRNMIATAQVLTLPGFALRVRDVVVDNAAVHLLSTMSSAADSSKEGDDVWLRAAPPEVRDAFERWRAPVPDSAFVVAADDDPDDPGDDDELDDDEDDAGDGDGEDGGEE